MDENTGKEVRIVTFISAELNARLRQEVGRRIAEGKYGGQIKAVVSEALAAFLPEAR